MDAYTQTMEPVTPQDSKNGASVDPQADTIEEGVCRLCKKDSGTCDWVACEVCTNYWVHLSCVGVCILPTTKWAFFAPKFNFVCPQHVQIKAS